MSFLTDLFGVGGDGGATELQRKALEEFNKVAVPDPEQLKVQLQKMVQQGVLTPQQAKVYLQSKSELSGITPDATSLNAAKTALMGLQDVYQQGGMTDIDRARLAEIQDKENTAERGSREAIMQNAAERGVGGSGLELANQLANQQNSATRKATSDLTVNADAQKRALEAMTQAGTMGANLEGQLFGQEATKASAQDAINKFNAATQNQTEQFNTGTMNAAQEKNLGEKQRVADTNVGIANTQETQNKGVPQTIFQDQLGKATGASGQMNKMAESELDKQKRKDAFTGNLIGAGATIGAAMLAKGGKIPGDPEDGDSVPALVQPGEVVVPEAIAEDPEAAVAFLNQPPEADTTPKTSINPEVAKMLLEKYSTPPGGDNNTNASASGADFSPEARQKLLESVRKPSTGQLIAMAMAGIGDSISASAGQPGKSLATASDVVKNQNEAKVKAFDAGREDVKFKREQDQQKMQDDPNSDISKSYQQLAAKYTGRDIGEFEGLSATKIGAILPTIEKAYQADTAAQARKDVAEENRLAREAWMNHTIGEKQDQWNENQWQKLTDKVNLLNAGSRRALGVAATNNMRADRLLETAKNPKVTSQDIANIVADIQAVYKGGVPDQVSLAHGDYQTFNRKLAEIATYITSNPQDAHSPGVVKRLEEIALELKRVDNKVIEDNLGINEVAFRKVIASDPKRWADLREKIMATTTNPGGNVMTATNPKTKEKIQSLDGGKTWQPIPKQ